MSDIADLDDDPEFDQMRELGRVAGELGRQLVAGSLRPFDVASAVAEDQHLVAAALVVLKELRKAGVIQFRDPGTVTVIPPMVGTA